MCADRTPDPTTGPTPAAGRPGIRTAGPADGSPPVLVHGIRVCARTRDPHTRRPTPRDRVTAPDLPGHRTRRERPLRLEEAVARVEEAVQEAALATGRPPLVAGASLGGHVARAAAHPDTAVLVQGATARPGHTP
ncbi:alpha/beta fold hydrolase [Streptomyces sp. BF23-19]|uniref:alpha/beta fold hydrolase n=1 Tax=unclassified Streptomyces TaxID=2593676 RepID=UPI0034E4ACCF